MIPANAGVAHLVERHLAQVEVASSSLVTRSITDSRKTVGFFRFLVPPNMGAQPIAFPYEGKVARR